MPEAKHAADALAERLADGTRVVGLVRRRLPETARALKDVKPISSRVSLRKHHTTYSGVVGAAGVDYLHSPGDRLRTVVASMRRRATLARRGAMARVGWGRGGVVHAAGASASVALVVMAAGVVVVGGGHVLGRGVVRAGVVGVRGSSTLGRAVVGLVRVGVDNLRRSVPVRLGVGAGTLVLGMLPGLHVVGGHCEVGCEVV